MTDTVYIGTGKFVWNVLENLGFEPRRFIEQSLKREIDIQKLDDSEARYDYEVLEQVCFDLQQNLSDECLSLKMVEYWHPGHLGALGYAWLSSKTLFDGFDRLKRFVHMISKRVDVDFCVKDNVFVVTLGLEYIRPGFHLMTDILMATTLRMCKASYGNSLLPDSANFVRPRPGCAKEFDDFYNCKVNYNATENSLVFPLSVIKEPLTGSDVKVASAIDQIIVNYISRLDASNIVDKVKAEIYASLASGKLTKEYVARVLHVSPRTLQRLLKQENTTYQSVVDEIRKELALSYAKNKSLPIIDIAFMLGFSDSSSFSRAFKRWTDEAPSFYRR